MASQHDEIVRGMADLFVAQVEPVPSWVKSTLLIHEAHKAGEDLVKLYEKTNGKTIKQIQNLDGERDGYDLGYRLAFNALGGRKSFHYLGSDKIKIPTFEVKLLDYGKNGDFVWEGSDEPPPSHKVREGAHGRQHRRNPSHAKSIAEVRELIASRPAAEKCHPTCQGWEVFGIDREPGYELEVCDECLSYFKDGLTDDDIDLLPEAQLALAKQFEADEAAEAGEVEGQVREIHGGKVVPRGNPGEQWYRVRWTMPDGKRDSAVYPHSYLETHLKHLRSKGLTDHDYTVTPEAVRHGRPPGVPNPGPSPRRGRDYLAVVRGEEPRNVGDRVKVIDDDGDWYGVIVEVRGDTVTVKSEEDRRDLGIGKGELRAVPIAWTGVRPKRNSPDIEEDLGINPRRRRR